MSEPKLYGCYFRRLMGMVLRRPLVLLTDFDGEQVVRLAKVGLLGNWVTYRLSMWVRLCTLNSDGSVGGGLYVTSWRLLRANGQQITSPKEQSQ